VFENNVVRKIYGSKRDEATEDGKNYRMKSFVKCNLYQIFLG
jgi:hypothetical protein